MSPLLTAHVEEVRLHHVQLTESQPLSYRHPVLQGQQGRALPVYAEEGTSVVHDAAVVVLYPVVVHLTLVTLHEVIPHRLLRGTGVRDAGVQVYRC